MDFCLVIERRSDFCFTGAGLPSIVHRGASVLLSSFDGELASLWSCVDILGVDVNAPVSGNRLSSLRPVET